MVVKYILPQENQTKDTTIVFFLLKKDLNKFQHVSNREHL